MGVLVNTPDQIKPEPTEAEQADLEYCTLCGGHSALPKPGGAYFCAVRLGGCDRETIPDLHRAYLKEHVEQVVRAVEDAARDPANSWGQPVKSEVLRALLKPYHYWLQERTPPNASKVASQPPASVASSGSGLVSSKPALARPVPSPSGDYGRPTPDHGGIIQPSKAALDILVRRYGLDEDETGFYIGPYLNPDAFRAACREFEALGYAYDKAQKGWQPVNR